MTYDPYKSALLMLAKIGPTSGKELLTLIPGLTKHNLEDMFGCKHIRSYNRDPDCYEVTRSGCKWVGIETTPKTRVVHERDDSSYKCPELAPFDGRPNCNQALSLPSRYMNTLTYRDGRTEQL